MSDTLRYLENRIKALENEQVDNKKLDDKIIGKDIFIQSTSKALMELQHAKMFLELELEKSKKLVVENNSMTKSEAFQAMKEGQKITHIHFGEEEYLYIDEKGRMFSEDGYRFEQGWKDKSGEIWEKNWGIYKDK